MEKVTKLKNRIKDADGPFKKKIQEALMKEVREMNLSKFVPEIS